MPSKLIERQTFRVHGFVMMKGLEGGNTYKVIRFFKYAGKDCYEMARVLKNGKLSKKTIGHTVNDVDRCIKDVDLNRIEILGAIPKFRKGDKVVWAKDYSSYKTTQDYDNDRVDVITDVIPDIFGGWQYLTEETTNTEGTEPKIGKAYEVYLKSAN